MRQPLFPSTTELNDIYPLEEFRLEKITTEIAEEDLDVLLNNADAITTQRGGSGDKTRWPYQYTLEKNIKDLAWLEVCTKLRQLASYVIRDETGRYVGCVYVYPIEIHHADKATDFDIDFSFWITQQDYDTGSYEVIYKDLLEWLRDEIGLDLKRVYLRNVETPEDVYALQGEG